MVAVLLGRKLGTSFGRDKIAENGRLSLELAALVAGRYPIKDVRGVVVVRLWYFLAVL